MQTVPGINLQPDPVLLEKARLLREAQFFVSTQDPALLHEKQAIFLVLARCKPVCEATSGHWLAHEGGRHTVPDDPKAVTAFIQSLGLACHVSQDEYGTDVLASLDQHLITEYLATSNMQRLGELFGYPATAAAAYGNNELLMPMSEQEILTERCGLDDYVDFRLSKAHWREELQAAWQCSLVLDAYGLTTTHPPTSLRIP